MRKQIPINVNVPAKTKRGKPYVAPEPVIVTSKKVKAQERLLDLLGIPEVRDMILKCIETLVAVKQTQANAMKGTPPSQLRIIAEIVDLKVIARAFRDLKEAQ